MILPLCWFAVKIERARRQRETVSAIIEVGGWVRYDYELDASGRRIAAAEAPGPTWLRELLGVDFFAEVIQVHFRVLQVTGETPPVTRAVLAQLKHLSKLEYLDLGWRTEITDAELTHLKELANLRQLFLDRTQLTDAGLVHLEGLMKVERLFLNETQVTDRGLAYLEPLSNLRHLLLQGTKVTDEGLSHLTGLKNLKRLWLGGTCVTDKGVRELQRALLNTEILYSQSCKKDAKR
jgi:Leucine-rich repeat (LRR) protein